MKMYILGFLVGFFVISINASSILQKPGKVIIDTDAGGDDASAILLALQAEKEWHGSGLEIIAITCTYGNTKVTNVVSNVLKTLTIAGRTDIPVYLGAYKPFMKNYKLDLHFGRDGLGDIDFGEDVKGQVDRSKHASVALVDLAKQYAGNVSILALGPVTNIALAIMLDPNFVHNVQRFYIVGCSPYGKGTIAPNTDFNFYQDPESNFIVLNSTTSPPAVILPSGVSRWAAISKKWRIETLGALNSRKMQFLNRVEQHNFGKPGIIWASADSILVALSMWPDLITRTTLTNVTPVYDGAARGAVLVDYKNKTGKKPNALLLDEFDVPKYKQLLLKSFA